MRSFIQTIFFTQRIHDNNNSYPDQVNDGQWKPEINRSEIHHCAGSFCNGMSGTKKQNDTEHMYQKKMYEIIKEWNSAIDYHNI